MKPRNVGILVGGMIMTGLGMTITANYLSDKLYKAKKEIPAIEYKSIYNINRQSLERFIVQSNPKIYGRMRKEIIDYATNSAQKYYLSSQLVLAMIEPESEFNTFAVSKADCIGLMQVNWKMWKPELIKSGIANKVEDLYDPQINIEAGCFILRKYIDQTKDLKQAIYKYLGSEHLPYYEAIQDCLGSISMINMSMEVVK